MTKPEKVLGSNQKGSQLEYKNGILYWGAVSLDNISNKYETPVYVYNLSELRQNLYEMSQAFQGITHIICYALKANANPVILQEIAAHGYGAEVVSYGELVMALNAGFSAEKIVFTGVGKTEDEISAAIKAGILVISVESIQELELVDNIAGELNKVQKILLRINPDIGIDSHPYIATGHHQSKFGIAIDILPKVLNKIVRLTSIRPVGLHLHLGSQIIDTKPIRQGMKLINNLAEECRKKGIEIQYLDIGGGLGYDYENRKNGLYNSNKTIRNEISPNEWAEIIQESLSSFKGAIILEPGRRIIASAGFLLTRVLYTKKMGGKSFLIINAGMNDLLRPALYNAYHDIVPVFKRPGSRKKWDIVGPICETGDFFAHDRPLSSIKPGDILAVLDVGAYGYVLSSQYNGRLRVPEVSIENNSVTLIRKRESLDCIIHTPFLGTGKNKIQFRKYSGLGNDFLLLDIPPSGIPRSELEKIFRQMCDRKFGIGADGVVTLNKKSDEWGVTFYNSDGRSADMCGNGLRCAALHLSRYYRTGAYFSIRTALGRRFVRVENTDVSIQIRIFSNPVPVSVQLSKKIYCGWLINTGVPHFVYKPVRMPGTGFRALAQRIRHHEALGRKRANVNFIRIKNRQLVTARIFERGVEDETLSSGTGASAVAVTAVKHFGADWPVSVEMPGGTFNIDLYKRDILWLRGAVFEICEGSFLLG